MFSHPVKLILVISLWTFCFPAGMAQAKPSVTIKHSYYNVLGRTASELREQMKKSPLGVQSKIWGVARTKWEVTWRFGFTPGPNDCRINHVLTSVQATFLMPRWKNSGEGSPELRERWQNFLNALQKHEDGHKDHGIDAAQEIETKLAGLKPMSGCSEMTRTINTTANSIIRKYQRKDFYYDLLTLHGIIQGAFLR
jgi:predicted secreted Zn-dependent protease